MLELSIITVCYNNLLGLQRTFASLRKQTATSFEWIVIDGGSNDGSREFIQRHMDDIAYWVSEPDRGIYHAMNKGIAAARGNYLQFLNAGDTLADSDVVARFLQHEFACDVVYGNAIIVDEDGTEVSRFIAPSEIRLSSFWSHTLNHQATFFHRRCFETYRYNEENKIASDVELFMWLVLKGYSFQRYDEVIVLFMEGGISSEKNHADEFSGIVQRLLPSGLRKDYKELIRLHDVDMGRMVMELIEAPRWYRYFTRLVLYPLYYIYKFFLRKGS